MSQIDEVSIPLTARKTVLLTRLSRGAGFVGAVSAGLLVKKLPAEKIALAAALLCSMELVTAGLTAVEDRTVKEEMQRENFGRPQEKLEAAGVGMGTGFVIVAAGLLMVKLLSKGKDDEQNTE